MKVAATEIHIYILFNGLPGIRVDREGTVLRD
jgi:hypothetical protein